MVRAGPITEHLDARPHFDRGGQRGAISLRVAQVGDELPRVARRAVHVDVAMRNTLGAQLYDGRVHRIFLVKHLGALAQGRAMPSQELLWHRGITLEQEWPSAGR